MEVLDKLKSLKMKNDHLQNVNFDFIRYSNCWEDVDILLDAFELNQNSKVISIASGGDNCFSLAAQSPEYVVAVDFSEVQLFLVELKKVAIKAFDRITYMGFIGFIPNMHRLEYYGQLNSGLTSKAQAYWDENQEAIEEGIVHFGKFERYFQLFKKDFLEKVHSQEMVEGLFAPKSEQEQVDFYNERWFDPRWEEMHSKFFGAQMLGEKGRDPEFMKQIEGSVSETILKREVNHLKSKYCQTNPFLFYILNNKFDEAHLPHYVRSENYDLVKENIDKVILKQGLLGKVAQEFKGSTHFNLSNIFEYMDQEHFELVGDAIVNSAAPNATLGYWNFMIDRNLADPLKEQVRYEQELSEALSAKDNGYFYSRFIVNKLI